MKKLRPVAKWMLLFPSSTKELPSGPGWGAAVGSEPSLVLAGAGASLSAFGLLPESPGFAHPPSPGRFCQPGCRKCRWRIVHLMARAQPWVSREWEGEHGQQWGPATIPCRDVHWDLLLSAQIGFNGYRSERKKEKQKEKDSFTCK